MFSWQGYPILVKTIYHMKTVLATLLLFSFSLAGFSQTDNEKREGKLLEGLGTYSGSFLYTAQNYLNTIKSAYTSKGLTTSQASEKLSLHVVILETLVKSSEVLQKEGLKDPNDVTFVKATIAIFERMKQQAEALKKYVNEGSMASLDIYNMLDGRNWDEIYEILGMDE